MAFRLAIETDNAAFDEDNNMEIIRILLKTVSQLSQREHLHAAAEITYDSNGNAVGSWHLD